MELSIWSHASIFHVDYSTTVPSSIGVPEWNENFTCCSKMLRQAEREIRGSFSIKEFLWPIQRLRTVDRFANIVQFQRESTPFAPVPQLFEGKHDCQLCDHEAND